MFYVYELLNPLKENQPFYVGKGQDGRAHRHFKAITWKESTINPHKTSTLRQIKDAGLEPSINITPCNTETAAFDLERELIQKYGRSIDGGILTNICMGGEGGSWGHKKVHQYNIFRDFVAEYPSMKAAAASVGVKHSSSIVAACKRKGSVKCPHGFVWCYENETPDWEWVFNKIQPVYQWDHDGNLIGKYKNLACMFINTNIDISTVKRFILSNSPKSYPGGYQFSHNPTFPNKKLAPSKRNKPVICLDTNTVFPSCTAAELHVTGKSSAKNISAACNGAVKTAYGFRWCFHKALNDQI
jgi:hypothetical protein